MKQTFKKVVHATAYCRYIDNNCLSFVEGVRIFDN